MADRENNLAYWDAITNVDFQRRCFFQFVITSIAVTTEDPATPDHSQRVTLAGKVLTGAFANELLATWVAENTTIQTSILADVAAEAPVGTSILDNDIAFQVNSVFTGIAASLPPS